MQKKYSSDNNVHLTKADLNSTFALKQWIQKNFGEEIEGSEIDTDNLISALDGISKDKNFISINEERKKDFIDLLNQMKRTLQTSRKL